MSIKLFMILLCLSLTGCGLTSKTLVRFSESRNRLEQIQREIYDDLQVCVWGIKENESTESRQAFADVALVILGEPSVEEKSFAKNATLEEIRLLKIESSEFISIKESLTDEIDSIEYQIVDGHDEDRSMLRMVIKIGMIIFGIVVSLVLGGFLLMKYIALKSASGGIL